MSERQLDRHAQRIVMVVPRVLREWGGVIALGVVLAASLSLNVWQGWRLRSLTAVQARGGIGIGTVLPGIPTRSLDGRQVVISFNQPTVVYAMSPSCIWCDRNHESILALVAASHAGYRWVGLAINTDAATLRRHLARWPMPFDVFVPDPPDLLERFAIRATPTTLVVDDLGTIRQAWVGAFMTTRLAAVESFFGVRLPGATPSK